MTLGELGRNDEEIVAYDEVVERFGVATELELRDLVGKALLFKGATLGELGRNNEAIVAYDEVVERFGTAIEPPLRRWVAMAVSYKGEALASSASYEE
jgi:L-rhamnose isomerase